MMSELAHHASQLTRKLESGTERLPVRQLTSTIQGASSQRVTASRKRMARLGDPICYFNSAIKQEPILDGSQRQSGPLGPSKISGTNQSRKPRTTGRYSFLIERPRASTRSPSAIIHLQC